MHQDRKITFTTSPGVYLDTPLDQKLLDPPHAEERARVVLPKGGGRTGDLSGVCPTQETAKTAEIPHTQSPLVFLAFLCLCGSRIFSFLRSSLGFYSRPHPLLPHPIAATTPSPECTGRGCNPSSMFTGWNAAPLLTTPSRSVKFFGENERLFIQAYLPLYWLDSNKWEEADGLPQNIKIMASKTKRKIICKSY